MGKDSHKKIYASSFHFKFIDNIVFNKRLEMANIINNFLKKYNIFDALDIGTTNDIDYKSSNILIKNIKNIKQYKSLSDQKITSDFFIKSFNKSITDDFSLKEIKIMSSDLVISNATIEHVGSKKKQIKMIKNIIKLTKKFFIITTPNKYYPIDYHTKIPFLFWFPKSFLNIFKIFVKNNLLDEDNLNLISKKDIFEMLSIFNNKISYEIFSIKLLGIKSNYIIIGRINN